MGNTSTSGASTDAKGREALGRSFGRRDFVKGMAATLGLAAAERAAGWSPTSLLGAAAAGAEEAAPEGAETVIGPDEQIYQGCCHTVCSGRARLNVHVRDGKIVKTSMVHSPYDEELDHICPKGLVHAQRTYAPERVQYPMRRIEGTKRGEGKWERLTWDEAIGYITDKWKGYIQEYGPASVGIEYGSGTSLNNQYAWVRLAHAFGGTHWMVYDCMASLNVGRDMFGRSAFLVGNDCYDILNSKNIFVWADNKPNTNFMLMPLQWKAIDKGAKLIVIDPQYSDMASKADMWVPIRPGSDGVLALAMANYYVENGMVAEDWLLKNSVSPFLIRTDTMKYVHAADIGRVFTADDLQAVQGGAVLPTDVAASAHTTDQEQGGIDVTDAFGRPVDYLVADADGNVGVTIDIASPVLDATVEINGVECKTAYALLKERLQEWPIERASEICDIPADTIRELAELYADGPSRLELGFGVDRYCNGGSNTVCIYTMMMLAGQMGIAGGGVGGHNTSGGVMHTKAVQQNFLATWYPPNPVYTSLMIPETYLGEVLETGVFNGSPLTVKSIVSNVNNHIATSPDRNEQLKIQEGIELLICCDTFMTETARHSDIVLPVCYNFEYETMTTYDALNEKAIEPLFESKSDVEITSLLGQAMGFEGFDITERDFMQMYYDNDVCIQNGWSYDRFARDKFNTDPGERVSFVYGNVDLGTVFTNEPMRATYFFENPMGMFDQTKPVDAALCALPYFKTPNEAWPVSVDEFPASAAAEKYPLYLLSPHDKLKVHTAFAMSPILTEIRSEPSVSICSADAAARGISDGDYVRVFNDRGEFVAMAHIDEATRPGVLQTEHGWWCDQYVDGNRVNSLNSTAMDDMWPALEHLDLLCEVEKLGD